MTGSVPLKLMGRGAAPWSRVLGGGRGGRLAGNRFSDGLPTDELASCYLLERLFLPSIVYLSIAGNRFTGLLSGNMSCSENLQFVDLSLNLLTGSLRPASAPTKNSDSKMVLFSRTLADALLTTYNGVQGRQSLGATPQRAFRSCILRFAEQVFSGEGCNWEQV